MSSALGSTSLSSTAVRSPVNGATAGLQWQVVAGRDLTVDQVQIWSQIQRANPALESPFFRPEFTQTLAAVRDDVFVAMALRNHHPVAFFPFQRSAWKTGSAVGRPLNDFQGVIASPDCGLNALELLRHCGLRSWSFDHVPETQRVFARYSLLSAASPRIDLSCGVPQYIAQRRLAGKSEFFKTQRKERQITRELGSLRLVTEDHNPELLQTLVAWKSLQYQRTRTPNIFSYDWVNRVLLRLLEMKQPEFKACFSVLYVNDALLALSLGLRSGDVYHCWMTSYNQAYAAYAPGRLLLLGLVKAAPELGIRVLDLGRGCEQFKRSFGNACVPLWEGITEPGVLRRWTCKPWLTAREWVRQSPYQNAIRVPWSWIRPVRDWMKYR